MGTLAITNEKRNISLDVLKFIAAIMITNSHLGSQYGQYSILATGGYLGDALFFFCSGFALFLKPLGGGNFINWYKRRINRIYPSMIANAFVGALFFQTIWSVVDIATAKGFWFIYCIMVYYVVIYVIGKYFPKKMLLSIGIICVITAIWYLCVYDQPGCNLYGGHPIRWLHSFNFMLLGAYLSSNRDKIKAGHPVKDVLLMLLFTAFYYAIFAVSERLDGPLVLIQYISMFPLFIAMYYFYKVGDSEWGAKIFNNKIFHFVIRFIGGLCLEIYLVQWFFLTDRFNHLFPLNILMIFGAVFVAAYLTRCLARLFSQTFREAPYEWKKIVSWF